MFDNQDSEAVLDPELLAKIERAKARRSAKEELAESISGISPANAAPLAPSTPRRPAPTARTPEQIMGGAISPPNTLSSQSTAGVVDPLAEHYRLLGLDPGSDYATVQAVYEKLLSRCRQDRFPAGSQEASEAQDIEHRLEATYRILREHLDPTARRFEMLEI